ncbi:MAG: aspartate kinase [bacterium]|nr:aspartate kinase [bacterium]
MRLIVQKFGGTSLATPRQRSRVVELVRQAVAGGYHPVLVVSAMGRAGDPYATDTFIQLALQIYPDTAPREMDLLLSCGEIISAVLVANTLRAAGLDAMALAGGQAGIVTDENFCDARIVRVEPEHLLRHINQGRLVVVAGFQGATEMGDVTTLGRGGSDTTAAALAAALGAERLEIYTDVDGVMTADPDVVPEARTLRVMNYQEIAQMAREGARVVHPRAVDISMRRGVPVSVRSLAGGSGTLIASPRGEIRDDRAVTGVTHLPGMAQIVVTPGPAGASPRMTLDVFRSLAENGISVDLINASPDRQSFIVAQGSADRAAAILQDCGFEVTLRKDCAKVSVVGMGMRGRPGVMARVVEGLYGAGVGILQTSDSHLTISCLVKQEDLVRAARALHETFGLSAEPDESPEDRS